MFIRKARFKFAKRLSLIFCVLFTLQTFVCHAEHAGLIPFEAHHSTEATSDSEASKPTTLVFHSCHCCPTAVLTTNFIKNSVLFIVETYFQLGKESCPDGPVRAIDHPPQLS